MPACSAWDRPALAPASEAYRPRCATSIERPSRTRPPRHPWHVPAAGRLAGWLRTAGAPGDLRRRPRSGDRRDPARTLRRSGRRRGHRGAGRRGDGGRGLGLRPRRRLHRPARLGNVRHQHRRRRPLPDPLGQAGGPRLGAAPDLLPPRRLQARLPRLPIRRPLRGRHPARLQRAPQQGRAAQVARDRLARRAPAVPRQPKGAAQDDAVGGGARQPRSVPPARRRRRPGGGADPGRSGGHAGARVARRRGRADARRGPHAHALRRRLRAGGPARPRPH